MAIPIELRQLNQWVCWRREIVDGRQTKVPYRADGKGRASSTAPRTWSSYESACRAVATYGFDGVGFVVTLADSIIGVDLDRCRIAATGAIHAAALAIVLKMNSYCEVSPSRSGLRLFGFGNLPADHPCRRGAIEVYTHKRFLTVTGDHLDGTPARINDITSALHWMFIEYDFPRPQPSRQRPAQLFATQTDHELIEKALQAKNGDRFARLWNGDWQAAGFSSQSEADLGLLSHLAYWCDGNVAQMSRLFEQSGLCRPKWLERGDYRTRTLARALAGVGHA
jgi:primase-polymerase (primpol)-like protein